MRIAELMKNSDQFISLEYFPPKERSAWPNFFSVVEKLTAVDPLFVSVTYGSGGGTQANTLELVTRIKKDFELEPMAHLTCVGASADKLSGFLDSLVKEDIDNVIALRGDPPKGDTKFVAENEKFQHASDLVSFINKEYPAMGVAVAAYAEKHQEAESLDQDIRYLKHKLDLGSDFAITQLFFDNDLYWSFLARARAEGIDKPVIPGIMPIFNLKLIRKIVSLCGAKIPDSLLKELEKADKSGDEKGVEKVGIEYARAQIKDLLAKGAPGVHLYTLNKAKGCLAILEGLL
ncbi:5,10-methylenetetrahydrofolate reductase [hydrothermal vent metagenome]|uniref:methylenetetrahydrofolate reductase (NADH) n=1 Tax=hydrothermal vent metagenome TaxID=652676 RepID=A0A3B1CMR2_9ZZZZ